jgi:hypothetical protein
MDPTDEPLPEQQELLNPRPLPESAAGFSDLQQQVLDLRTLFNAALVGLIALAIAADLFFGKQMMLVRRQIEEQQPNFDRTEIEFRRNRDPEIRRFMDELHRFSATHPDYRTTILDRYRFALAQYFTTAPGPAEPAPIPQGTNANSGRLPGR